jgi:eukaryotic-like serine/threonine-protein kinase
MKVAGRGGTWLRVSALAVVVLVLAAAAACGGRGADEATVPTLVGLDQQAALAALAKAHLAALPSPLQYSEQVASGAVVSQDPAPGTQVLSGAEVLFTVSRGSQLVRVPDFSREPIDQVAGWLSDHGLVAQVVQGRSDRVGPGLTFRQSPAAGTQVSAGRVVTVWQDSGLAQVEVPDVRGVTLDDAHAALTRAGLTFGVAATQASSAPDGEVIGQSVPSGSTVAVKTSVDLTVSSGPGTTLAEIPSVVGLQEPAAVSLLTEAGFENVTAAQQASSDAPAGQVIAQTPAGGESVSTSAEVQLIVSAGPTVEPAPVNVVPNVVGLTQAAALTQLSEAGFNEVVISHTSEGTPGHVARQMPVAGTEYSTLRVVTLIVTID